MKAKRLTCNSFTIIKHRSLSNPFRPKVPNVVWISEKRRLLVTSWWVFISYQVFSWSIWHVILKQKQNTPQTQQQLSIHPKEMWGSTELGAADMRKSHDLCWTTSVFRHPEYFHGDHLMAQENVTELNHFFLPYAVSLAWRIHFRWVRLLEVTLRGQGLIQLLDASCQARGL